MTTGLLGATASALGAAVPAGEDAPRGASLAGLAQATSRMPTRKNTRLHNDDGDMAPLRDEYAVIPDVVARPDRWTAWWVRPHPATRNPASVAPLPAGEGRMVPPTPAVASD